MQTDRGEGGAEPHHPRPRLTAMKSPPAALALLLLVAACGGGGDDEAAAGPAKGDSSLLVPYGDVPSASEGSTSGGAALAADSAVGAPSGSTGTAALAPREPAPGPVSSDPLRAGSVDDNARFADYLAFRKRSSVAADALDITERHVITVRDRDGLPVLGATVVLADGQKVLQSARTHADGRALLFPLVTDEPQAKTYDLRVTSGQVTASARIDDRAVREHALTLDTSRLAGPTRLDLHFLLDTTGSMGDEIDRLRDTLGEVATKIDALPQKPEVRYGLTLYKDHGDAYVSRTGDFTDLQTFQATLAKVTAGGGGDTPEALDEALHGAVNGPSWDSDRAVQIAFLIGDASPHLGDGGVSYAQDIQVAAAKGIEVVPLASSGSDDDAEYVFRQLAQYSLGTFFFLTYGADGRTPGDTTTLDVKGFQTGSLDELIVKHVTARLAARDGREQ